MSSDFNFFQHWYPLSTLKDLDATRPIPFTLLGMRLVIWKPKFSETYRVFLDQCPHRLAPLSEGKIDDISGNLMCSYHGWQFDPQGHCTTIPQAKTSELSENQLEYLCAIALPTREEQELLWVWPDLDTSELAETTPLPLSPHLDPNQGMIWVSLVRDLEYDWQTLVENVVDPSHVPFSHHGVQGNRKNAQPLPLQIIESNGEIIESIIERKLRTKLILKPPCLVEYSIDFGGKKKGGLVIYCIPSSPGKSRIIGFSPRNFAKLSNKLTPRWWDHITHRMLVFEGDMILLHKQEYFLQQKMPQETWKTAYKMPTSADRFIIEFRKWFDQYCQGKLPWEKVGISEQTPSINENRQEILNRYQQHTQHCSSCRGALKGVKRLQIALLVYFILAISNVALLPDELRLKVGLPLMSLALLGMLGYAWLKLWLEPRFYFVDYIHADR